MKKHYTIAFILLLLASCQKDTTAPIAFSYNVNGSAVTGSNYTAVYHYDTTANMQAFQVRFYTGNAGSNKYMQLNCVSTNYILPGTYTYGALYPENTTGSMSLTNDSVQYVETAGNFQVTQIDTIGHKISGKFQFTAVNSIDSANIISITNGEFTTVGYLIQ